MIVVEFLFWIALGLIVYAYAGFPLLLAIRSLFPSPVRAADITPTVSLVIIAHNEARSIEAKLENALGLDYDQSRLEIIVGSDGSTDGTDEIVERFAGRGVRLVRQPRQGKIPTLNATVALATGEILVFSDANSMYRADAVRRLVRSFADATVGAVAGNQCYQNDKSNAASVGERSYWAFDRFLKTVQARAGNVISSTGAIHAVRRSLFQPVPNGVCDDSLISRRAILAGYRLTFEPEAIAYESTASTDEAEFSRKTRVITRGLSGLWEVRALFNPLRFGFYSIQIFSHKLLRWSVVWLMAFLIPATAVLYPIHPIYQWAALAQALFYGSALLVLALRRTPLARSKLLKPLAIPYFFCLANFAALQAWLRVLQGTRLDIWATTHGESLLKSPPATGS